MFLILNNRLLDIKWLKGFLFNAIIYPHYCKMKFYITRQIHLILLTTFLFFNANAQNADIALLRYINLGRNTKLDPTFKFVSHTSAGLSVATPLVIYGIGLIKKDSSLKKNAIYIGETILVSAIVTTALKNVIKRERPFIAYPDIEKEDSGGSYAMPSGHTANAFSTATSLSMAYPKWYVITPAFAWATTVGYSRLHLGVHYPSDVFAGAFIGAGSAYVSYKVNKWIHKKWPSKIKKM